MEDAPTNLMTILILQLSLIRSLNPKTAIALVSLLRNPARLMTKVMIKKSTAKKARIMISQANRRTVPLLKKKMWANKKRKRNLNIKRGGMMRTRNMKMMMKITKTKMRRLEMMMRTRNMKRMMAIMRTIDLEKERVIRREKGISSESTEKDTEMMIKEDLKALKIITTSLQQDAMSATKCVSRGLRDFHTCPLMDIVLK
jgi:hypothetical protein